MTSTDIDGCWRPVSWHDALPHAPRVVAFQGERGAYGDLAIEMLWPDAPPLRECCRDFEGAVGAVARGRADAAVIPVHNEIIGEVPGGAASIAKGRLRTIGEVVVPVRHCLLAVHGASLEAIVAAWSHPVALAQCGIFLARNPRIAPREAYDTAGAAREVAARRIRAQAAIAPEGCASRYGLDVLARDIGDRADNATRFAVVTKGR